MATISVAGESRTDSVRDWRAIRERATRGLLTFNGEGISHLEGDLWAVRSSQGGFYRVDLGEESCDCPDFTYYGHEYDVSCKHIVAVAIAHAHRRSGVREVREVRVAAGDPFKAASRSEPRRDCPACFAGYVTVGTEEDGVESYEPVACRRCGGSGRA